MVIHGNHMEELRALAVEWMRAHPLMPLENEVLLVQSNGIAQWLKLALAADDGCGVAAALQVDLPARFLWQAYRSVLGREAIPQQSPLDKAALTWRLMRLLPTLIDGVAFTPLKRFLANDGDMRKCHQLAERLADLFDQYQVYRADWLTDWAEGRDQLRTSRGGTKPLEGPSCWQPLLWRALLADVGEEQFAHSRAGIHPRFLARLRELDVAPAGLPRRVSVFGISSLPAQTLEALAALGRFCQVMLYVHNPCQHHWGDIVEDKDLLRHAYRRQKHRPAPIPVGNGATTMHQNAQPLLAAWGKQGRDYINLLDQYDEPQRYREQFERIDLFTAGSTDTLLGQLQNDILDLRPPPESHMLWPPVDTAHDQSLRFHVAHGAQREVEILHDQLLASFNDDPSLRPRDVIVMVPDIDHYAPHIEAVFGRYPAGDQRFIPFSVTDRGLRGQAPIVIAVEHLLRLPESRLATSEVLDLLDVAALRARFGLGDEDVTTLRRWLDGAGVRWGLDARQRESLGVGAGLEQNTWRFGLRRMLLGYAVGRGSVFAGIEPYDEIGGLDAALIGPLMRLVDTLEATGAVLAEPATPTAWGERLTRLLDEFFEPQDDRDEMVRSQLLDALDGWQALCETAGFDEPLPLTVVREAWLGSLDDGRLSQRFLGGAVNFCTLMPMRAIPFRLVCLLGMNDGDYPRTSTPVDFDLMTGDYRPGDRSRREDDRYLLLEALLAARDKLYVSWVGRSARDNSERPASVLVGQLRDHLDNVWASANGEDLLPALTVEHPLQPFSPRYFGEDPRLFTFAREWAVTPSLPTPATGDDGGPVRLPAWGEGRELDPELLQMFLRDPVKCFFQKRLHVRLDQNTEEERDTEPFALDALQRYQLQDELLRSATHDEHTPTEVGLRSAADRLQRSGRLPLAGFGKAWLQTLVEPLPAQLRHYEALCATWPQRVDAPLPVSCRTNEAVLEGWLDRLRQQASGELARVSLQPGTLGQGLARKWHRLLRPFVIHVAAAAGATPITSIVVGEDLAWRLPPLEPEAARDILATWLMAWTEGMQTPLPVALKTAIAFLVHDADKARIAYEGDFSHAGEVASSASLARIYPDFDALGGDGRFASWSERLYGPLLASDVVEELPE